MIRFQGSPYKAMQVLKINELQISVLMVDLGVNMLLKITLKTDNGSLTTEH